MAAPKEICNCHREMKAIDRGAYYLYSCTICRTEIKNYKPLVVKPGDRKRFAPER